MASASTVENPFECIISKQTRDVIKVCLLNENFSDACTNDIIKLIMIMKKSGISNEVLEFAKAMKYAQKEEKFVEDYYCSNEIDDSDSKNKMIDYALKNIHSDFENESAQYVLECHINNQYTSDGNQYTNDGKQADIIAQKHKLYRLRTVKICNAVIPSFFEDDHQNYVNLNKIILENDVKIENMLTIINHFAKYDIIVRNFQYANSENSEPMSFITIYNVKDELYEQFVKLNKSLTQIKERIFCLNNKIVTKTKFNLQDNVTESVITFILSSDLN